MACLYALALFATAGARADTVVVTADRMIDVLADRVVEHPQISITDGRIVHIGSQNTPVAPGTRRVELPGLTLLPGPDRHARASGQAPPAGDQGGYGQRCRGARSIR
jgi:cytosine/adenosine deaminase-related metal-dependent hydrolase